MKTNLAAAVVSLFLAGGGSAIAQTTDPVITIESGPAATVTEDAVEAAVEQTEAAVAEAGQEAGGTIEDLRNELYARLEDSRLEMESILKETQTTTGLTDTQIYGIAVGIVAGAVAADLLGASGIGSLAITVGGAAVGSWVGGAVE